MNEVYTFTGELINDHLEQHLSETAGAKSYNNITCQTFDKLVNYNYGEVHPTVIRQRIVHLLNTILFGEYLVVDDQIRLVITVYERFVIYDDEDEEINPSSENQQEDMANVEGIIAAMD
ncbi:742_t:CDS:2 [Ambispora gerdemannii]|uniref:742_t:CDS:1 n=1 Tax=Ambispora gerdemannii TaxID=144530 RepID=A0A9N8UY19_9GLOM|nr:742_t:CDS:2 [Ambispora gerdemannii]